MSDKDSCLYDVTSLEHTWDVLNRDVFGGREWTDSRPIQYEIDAKSN